MFFVTDCCREEGNESDLCGVEPQDSLFFLSVFFFFLEAALCSQTWCHGTSGGCTCTSHVHTGAGSALTLLFVCICQLRRLAFTDWLLHRVV